jgi:hypothetical protein
MRLLKRCAGGCVAGWLNRCSLVWRPRQPAKVASAVRNSVGLIAQWEGFIKNDKIEYSQNQTSVPKIVILPMFIF